MFLSLSETLEKKKAGVHGSCVWISSWIKQITRKIKNTHLKKKVISILINGKNFMKTKVLRVAKMGRSNTK